MLIIFQVCYSYLSSSAVCCQIEINVLRSCRLLVATGAKLAETVNMRFLLPIYKCALQGSRFFLNLCRFCAFLQRFPHLPASKATIRTMQIYRLFKSLLLQNTIRETISGNGD